MSWFGHTLIPTVQETLMDLDPEGTEPLPSEPEALAKAVEQADPGSPVAAQVARYIRAQPSLDVLYNACGLCPEAD